MLLKKDNKTKPEIDIIGGDSQVKTKTPKKFIFNRPLVIIVVSLIVVVSTGAIYSYVSNGKDSISEDEIATYGDNDVEDLTVEQKQEIINKNINPAKNPQAAEVQAKVIDALGDTEKAVNKYEDILGANPTADSYEQYATALARDGDWSGGIVVLEEGILFVENNTSYSTQEKSAYISKLENRKYVFEQELNSR